MLYYERKFKKKGYSLIIGVDEAGRGPLAGPVVAAAVTLSTYRFKNRIDDSKKLTHKLRDAAFSEILQKSVFGIGIVNEKTIDEVNILQATRIAMEEAINSVIIKLESSQRARIGAVITAAEKNGKLRKGRVHIIVDGNIRLDIPYFYTGIIKGDAKSKSIASASILAKVVRDRIMKLYDRFYPQYGFIRHKGYPTRAHRDILKKIGPSRIHRRSFCCV